MHDDYDIHILNSWEDNDEIYVDYMVKDRNNPQVAHVCTALEKNGIGSEIEKYIQEHLKKNNGLELTLPKVSELSPLLTYIFDFVCESEANMCHIDYNDWEELKLEDDFVEKDIETLKEEIRKYNLDDYITLDDGEYMICGYGGLQCCFNDDRGRDGGHER